MKYSIKRRHVLVAIVAATQAVCLSVGMMLFSAWLHQSVQNTMLNQVLHDNVLVAGQMSKLIDRMNVDDLRENVDSWTQLQDAIRDLTLPNDGFVCLVDADSEQLLCHPALQDHPTAPQEMPGKPGAETGMQKPAMQKPGMVKPAMQKPAMTKPAMVKPAMQKPTMTKPAMVKPAIQKPAMAKSAMAKADMVKPTANESELVRTSSWGKTDQVEGRITDHFGELQVVAAAFLPGLNAHVKVHQKASSIQQTVGKVLQPLLPLGAVVGLGLIAFTTLLITSVMRRYDYRLAAVNEGLEDLVDQRTCSLRKTRDAVVFGLAKLAESRDTDTGEHLDRIRLYVTILAAQIEKVGEKRGKNYIETMALASSLHDIGKVGIPDSVLLKPGHFTGEEREIMETHAALGGDCLKAIGKQLGDDDFLQLARDIAYGHHEKWDGSGYPFGIAGDAIPISARIVALADVYDALRSKRPYKNPMPHEKAKAIIIEGRGSHFDPQVVDAFIQCEELFVEVSQRYNAIEPTQPGIGSASESNPQPVLA